jgi:hypothetical protein
MQLKVDFGEDRAAAGGRPAGYVKLFGLAVRHGYCNASGGDYAGIAVSPSPVTAARLPRHGLLARLGSDGIDLVWNGIRGSGSGWSEPLLFVMGLHDQRFFNFTDLPTDTCSGRPILRYSTAGARAGRGSNPPQVLEREAVPAALGSASEEGPPQGAWVDQRGETAAAADERKWFRSPLPDPPFGLVEVALPPDGHSADYVVGFEARPTWWRYLVASRGHELDLDSLTVEHQGGIRFHRAGTRALPDGRTAAVFEPSGALLLQQRSPERLQLRGISGGGRSTRVLVDPLPTPSAETILPEPVPAADREAQRVWSEIYVFV